MKTLAFEENNNQTDQGEIYEDEYDGNEEPYEENDELSEDYFTHERTLLLIETYRKSREDGRR